MTDPGPMPDGLDQAQRAIVAATPSIEIDTSSPAVQTAIQQDPQGFWATIQKLDEGHLEKIERQRQTYIAVRKHEIDAANADTERERQHEADLARQSYEHQERQSDKAIGFLKFAGGGVVAVIVALMLYAAATGDSEVVRMVITHSFAALAGSGVTYGAVRKAESDADPGSS